MDNAKDEKPKKRMRILFQGEEAASEEEIGLLAKALGIKEINDRLDLFSASYSIGGVKGDRMEFGDGMAIEAREEKTDGK
jgi:hypothetical protein